MTTTTTTPSDDSACSPSLTPETDAAWKIFQDSPHDDAGDPWALCSRMERERNEWKQHAWRESDMREKLQGEIMALVTTNNESKESFIHRVRGILSENAERIRADD